MTSIPTNASQPDLLYPKSFGKAFWMLNIMEMFERLAYYGMRVVVPIYIMQADEPNGLHFTAADKGTIYLGWALMQSILPMFTGGYADRYGFKLTIAISITIKIIGYLLMATQRTYWGFFAGALVLAAGTAIFKPGIQGSLAQNLTKRNSSLGWSLFYQCVNLGAFIGPFLAHYLKVIGWPAVFYGCAAIVSLNYLMLLTYKDPPSGGSKQEGFLAVFVTTIVNIFNARLLALILILSGFWMMMYQIWDLHPNFIVDWVDSTAVAKNLEVLPDIIKGRMLEETSRGVQVSQEQMLNLNSLLVLLFVSIIGHLVAGYRSLTCMIGGIIMATFGVMISGWTMSGYAFLLGIVFFSLGEMLTGPKKLEYFALIAPPGKKGLYLGYVNVPVAIGQGLGAMIAGHLYGQFGEKATLALKYIAQHTEHGASQPWDGHVSTLESTLGITRSESFAKLQDMLNENATQVTELLWNTYHPHYVWIPFGATGVICALGLIWFAHAAKKWSDMNA